MTKTKNHAGQIISLLMCLAMMLTLLAPSKAFAENEAPYTITIVPNDNTLTPKNSDPEIADSLKTRFTAYSIFNGDLGNYEPDDEETESPSAHMLNVPAEDGWGNGVNKTSKRTLQNLLTRLMSETTTLEQLGVSAASFGGKYDNTEADIIITDSSSLGTVFRQSLILSGGFQVDTEQNNYRITEEGDKVLANTAKYIADAIVDLNKATVGGNNVALANLFAGIMATKNSSGGYEYLNNNDDYKKSHTSEWNNDDKNGYWTIGNLDKAGYYLILDTLNSADGSQQSAISEYMLAVFGTQYIQMKSSIPTVDKKIISTEDTAGKKRKTGEDGNEVLLNGDNAGIGDTVTFKLTGTLPENFNSYNEYKYIFHDKMSDGLDFKDNTLKVYAEEEDGTRHLLKKATDESGYVLYTNSNDIHDDECTFEVVFADLKKVVGTQETVVEGEPTPLKITETWKIIVEYQAVVNEKAVIIKGSNPNTVQLEYSNNVYDPDSTGQTPEETVYVYVYGLDVAKIDGTTNATLGGAEFSLTKTGDDGKPLYAVFTVNQSPDEAAGEIRRNDIHYTIVEWISKEKLDSLISDDSITWGTRLKLSDDTYVADTGDWSVTTRYLSIRTATGNDKIYVKGLDSETKYTLTEEFVPATYDKMANVEFTIHAEIDQSNGKLIKVEVESSARNDAIFENPDISNENAYIPVQLANMPSGYLPGTGGAGTILFYTGGVLMLALGGLHIYRRKKLMAKA